MVSGNGGGMAWHPQALPHLHAPVFVVRFAVTVRQNKMSWLFIFQVVNERISRLFEFNNDDILRLTCNATVRGLVQSLSPTNDVAFQNPKLAHTH